MFHVKNMKVTRLQDAVLTGFKLNEVTRTINLSLIADFKVTSDIVLRFDEKDKFNTGNIELRAKVKVKTHYNFEIETDHYGLEHLRIGQETTTCECIENPEFALDDVLRQALITDPDVEAKLQSIKQGKRRKKLVSKIAEMAMPKLFEAYRQDCNGIRKSGRGNKAKAAIVEEAKRKLIEV